MDIGERIKARREFLNMTTEDLGKKIGVQRSAITKYEKGRIDLKSKQILSIARALEISPAELFETDSFSPSNEMERRLIAAFRNSEPSIQKAALRMLEDSAAEEKSKIQDTASDQTA